MSDDTPTAKLHKLAADLKAQDNKIKDAFRDYITNFLVAEFDKCLKAGIGLPDQITIMLPHSFAYFHDPCEFIRMTMAELFPQFRCENVERTTVSASHFTIYMDY